MRNDALQCELIDSNAPPSRAAIPLHVGAFTAAGRKELEEENKRLKKLLAEAELDKAILKEALQGNY